MMQQQAPSNLHRSFSNRTPLPHPLIIVHHSNTFNAVHTIERAMHITNQVINVHRRRREQDGWMELTGKLTFSSMADAVGVDVCVLWFQLVTKGMDNDTNKHVPRSLPVWFTMGSCPDSQSSHQPGHGTGFIDNLQLIAGRTTPQLTSLWATEQSSCT